MTSNKNNQLLARVNFPPYTVKMLSARYLLVAGGGGKAKSGIANVIEIYELSYDGIKCLARPASRFEIGDSACMNCAAWSTGNSYTVAAGLDGKCQLYKVKPILELDTRSPNLKDYDRQGETRRRTSRKDSNTCAPVETPTEVNKSQPKDNHHHHNDNRVIGFHFTTECSFQTDFPVNDDEPYQKAVRISPDLNFLVTGGSDGHLRVWQFPELTLLVSFQAHNDDIDDLDIHPLGDMIVSVSRDGHTYVWSLTQKKKITELEWDSGTSYKYRCRNCRFGVSKEKKNKLNLFTAYVPVIKAKNAPQCYIVKWDAADYVPQKIQSVGKDLSSLTVSEDGRYVAIGTMSGAVAIYISFSLQRIYYLPQSHSNFITGLQFLPAKEETDFIVGSHETSLVSISVDNQIKIHHIPQQESIGIGTYMLLMSSVLMSTFVFMNYLDL